MENGKKIVLSGIQPSGIPTIGNYVPSEEENISVHHKR